MVENDIHSGRDEPSPLAASPSVEAAPPDSDRAGNRERGATRWAPDKPCPNCGDATSGDYCRACGQEKRAVVASLRILISDVLDQLLLYRKLPRTLLYLAIRPGFLTHEYVNGRIVRYTAPFRLYLVTSIVFFLLLSFFGLRALNRGELSGLAEANTLSTTASLAAGLSALEGIDTTGMPAETREALTVAMRGLSERLEGEAAGASAPEDSDDVVTRQGLQPWAVNMLRGQTRGLSAVLAERVARRYGHLPPDAAVRDMFRQYAEYVPHTVFMLLPIFALILKVLYIRRDRYYVEHFIFALHIHAFTFLVLTLMLLIGSETLHGMLFLGIMFYLWLAMKRAYGQDWFRTTAKYSVLWFAYSILLGFAGLVPAVILLLLA